MTLFLYPYYASVFLMLLFTLFNVRVLWLLSKNIPDWVKVVALIVIVFCPLVNTIAAVALVMAYITTSKK